MTAPDTRRPELAAWLLERVAEDEAVARAAVESSDRFWRLNVDSQGDWISDFDNGNPLLCGYAAWEDRTGSAIDSANLAHAARHDPARVLAECEAKRRIVALHPPALWIQPESPLKDPRTGKPYTEAGEHWGGCEVCDGDNSGATYPCPTLRALAQPYAGAPGWREEWAL